ncbi:hypothetical protein AVEN_209733-1 [Araneus ventricosus]|uniref:Uncharacterized protein n=1 Tax=Araneus ventricosus TaxID=182803 RepID=A0A4Y2CDT1_ARAVE|nr:hypothetical protein AVEN_209733-1 [Araneus ventricosus]
MPDFTLLLEPRWPSGKVSDLRSEGSSLGFEAGGLQSRIWGRRAPFSDLGPESSSLGICGRRAPARICSRRAPVSDLRSESSSLGFGFGGLQARNPILLKILRVLGLLLAKSHIGVKPPPAGAVQKFGERGCQLRCRPRHLTAVLNYELRPKIAQYVNIPKFHSSSLLPFRITEFACTRLPRHTGVIPNIVCSKISKFINLHDVEHFLYGCNFRSMYTSNTRQLKAIVLRTISIKSADRFEIFNAHFYYDLLFG